MPFAATGMDLRYCVSEISQREGNILRDITCMWNLKKIQQTSEYKQKKKKANTDIENKLVVANGEGQNGMGEQEVQAVEYKVGSRMYCKTQGI